MTIIAIFDLDHTLLEGDSDALWGEYMVDQKMVKNEAAYRDANQQFYEDYQQGKLDVLAYLAFSLKPLMAMPDDELLVHSHRFIEEVISPRIRTKGLERIQWHKKQGHTIVIATATNDFITTPIAKICQADALIATKLERISGHYTGEVIGDPAYGMGKVAHLKQWFKDNGHSWVGSYGYSDSHVDLPLLETVSTPVVINPDEVLKEHAREHDWESMDFSLAMHYE